MGLTPLMACAVWAASGGGAPAAEPGSGLSRYMSLVEDLGFSGSVLVNRGEVKVFERCVGYANRDERALVTPQTLFDSGSISKSFTAAALLRLAEQGRLKLSDRIATHLGDVPLHTRDVTVEMLLRHTSGLHTAGGMRGVATDDPAAVIAAVMSATPTTPPGEYFAYDNIGYTIAAIIAEKTTGKDFVEVMHTEAFKPAGLATTYCADEGEVPEERSAHGYERGGDAGPCARFPYDYGFRGATGILTTPTDLAKWARAVWMGSLLTPASREAMFRQGKGDYGLGWYVERLQGPAAASLGSIKVYHDGATRGFDAALAFWPEYPGGFLSVAVMSNDRFWLPTIAREIESLATTEGSKVLPVAGVLPVEALTDLAGEYIAEPGERMIVEVDARGRPGLAGTLRLTPMSQEAFDRIFLGGEYHVERTNDGKRIWPRVEAVMRECILPGTREAVIGGFYRGDENPGADVFYTDWTAIVRELGDPTGFEPLYTGLRSLVDRTLVSNVLVTMPKGRRVLTIVWTGRVEKAATILIGTSKPPAAVTFEPDEKAKAGADVIGFFSFRPQGIAAPRIEFRKGPSGGYDALELLDPSGKGLTLMRKR